MANKINMQNIKVDGSVDLKEYKESLLELFDHDEKACSDSVDKHYSFGIGVNIEGVVKDALNKDWIETYSYELYDLGDKQTLLTIAWIDK